MDNLYISTLQLTRQKPFNISCLLVSITIFIQCETYSLLIIICNLPVFLPGKNEKTASLLYLTSRQSFIYN